jgi:hypothetical protein
MRNDTPKTPVTEQIWSRGVIANCELARRFHGKPPSRWQRSISSATQSAAQTSGQRRRESGEDFPRLADPEIGAPVGKHFQLNQTQTA